MPLNGNRPTFRSEDAATCPIGVSARVRDFVQSHRKPGETIDCVLRRLLQLEPRKRLKLVGIKHASSGDSGK